MQITTTMRLSRHMLIDIDGPPDRGSGRDAGALMAHGRIDAGRSVGGICRLFRDSSARLRLSTALTSTLWGLAALAGAGSPVHAQSSLPFTYARGGAVGGGGGSENYDFDAAQGGAGGGGETFGKPQF